MTDTIFALSSGSPPAAIAVVRISGPEAGVTLAGLAGDLPAARRAAVRPLSAGETHLDTALILWFPGPNSATGEDLAELHLHGGRAVIAAVEAALAAMPGLRRAEPGEFTRRAFQNGRIDLAEAEGLSDLLFAETEWQRAAAIEMASGRFSGEVEHWREAVLRLGAMVEAALDFSDEGDVGDAPPAGLADGMADLEGAMRARLAAPSGERLRDGIRVVLAGPPNSGKSTLFNALAGREAAIVSDIAGTTRDVIEAPVALSGIPFLLIDTAGLREDGAEAIEAIGIDRAHGQLDRADLVLWLGPEGGGPEPSAQRVVWEVDARCDDVSRETKQAPDVRLSAKTGVDLDKLVAMLVEAGRAMLPRPGEAAINARQGGLIEACADALSDGAQALAGDADLLIVAEQLRLSRLALDALLGNAQTEDMLDALFGRFCIGK